LVTIINYIANVKEIITVSHAIVALRVVIDKALTITTNKTTTTVEAISTATTFKTVVINDGFGHFLIE